MTWAWVSTAPGGTAKRVAPCGAGSGAGQSGYPAAIRVASSECCAELSTAGLPSKHALVALGDVDDPFMRPQAVHQITVGAVQGGFQCDLDVAFAGRLGLDLPDTATFADLSRHRT